MILVQEDNDSKGLMMILDCSLKCEMFELETAKKNYVDIKIV